MKKRRGDMSKMKNKHQNLVGETIQTHGGDVATEAIPLNQMTRDQMLDHLQAVDPDTNYTQLSDDDLKSFVSASHDEPLSAATEEQPATEQPGEIEQEKPAEEKPEPAQPADVKAPVVQEQDLVSMLRSRLSAEDQKIIDDLQSKIKAASERKGTKRVASGSKARPNVKYTLLSKPPSWHNTPQVAQLQQIIFDPTVIAKYKQPDGSVVVAEPELFALIEQGAKSGVLRTKQPPVRIFQYYRNDLLIADSLRWK